jgi:hypothetical protein
MIKQFVIDFFMVTNSVWREQSGVLEVELSDELKPVFNQPSLRLVFDPHDVSEDSELVCHGSYVLNTIHQYLQTHGAKTVSRLIDKYKPTDDDIHNLIRIENGTITKLKLKKIKTVDLLFNFKASFLSDEKSEEIYRIGVDRHGVVFQADQYYRDEMMKADMTSLSQIGTMDVSRKDVESHFRDCLKAASEQSKSHAKSIQNDILKRLHRNIARIKGYYAAQIEELHQNQPSYEEKRIAIEREYDHKLKEEISNHRLRIVLKLINMQIVERSEFEIQIKYTQRGSLSERPYQLIYDTYTGELDYGLCPLCQASMETIVITHDLQVACQHCSYTCTQCGKHSGEIQRAYHCHQCNEVLCPDCVTVCHDCKQPACGDHSDLCAIGNEWVCSGCKKHCSVCNKTLCAEHAFICSKTNQTVCYEHRIICKHCRKIFSTSAIKKSDPKPKCPSCKSLI